MSVSCGGEKRRLLVNAALMARVIFLDDSEVLV